MRSAVEVSIDNDVSPSETFLHALAAVLLVDQSQLSHLMLILK